jgi:hypothetical protein
LEVLGEDQLTSNAPGKLFKPIEEFVAATKEIHDLQDYSDRAIAIVGGCLLETALEFAILWKLKSLGGLKPQSDYDLCYSLFVRRKAPFPTFAAKIRRGREIDLISPELESDLKAIKNVRNRFAHSLIARDFDDKEVSNLCSTLEIGGRHQAETDRVNSLFPDIIVGPCKRKLNSLSKSLIYLDSDDRVWTHVPSPDFHKPTTAKEQFIQAVQVCWIILFAYGVPRQSPSV